MRQSPATSELFVLKLMCILFSRLSWDRHHIRRTLNGGKGRFAVYMRDELTYTMA